ncbi:hypothetical protein Tco_1187304 [Tanacetum coccineum]
MFIKYSTGQIPPKRSRCKGSQGKKTADVSQESVDVSKESEPEHAKKKASSRITRGVVIQDPLSAPKPKPAASKLNLKGVQYLISKKTRKPAEDNQVLEAQVKDLVISEANVILEWGSENESEHSDDSQLNFDNKEKKDKDGDADDEGDDHISDIQDTDDEDAETKSDEDEIYKYKTHVRKDEDEEMLNAEVEDSRKGDAKISDVAKANAKKIEEIKDDAKKAELPPTSSSLPVSLGFGDQFLKLSSDTSLVSTYPSVLTVLVLVISEPVVATPIPLTPLVSPATTHLTISSVSTIPHVPHQTTAPIPTPPIITDAPTITTVVPKSDALSVVQLRVAKLEKDVSELKKIDHSAKALATLKSQVPMVVEHYPGSKIASESSKTQKPTIDLEQESEKSALEIRRIKREQVKKKKMPKYTIKFTDKAALKEYDKKSVICQTMHENKSFNRNPANHALYHALIEALIDD